MGIAVRRIVIALLFIAAPMLDAHADPACSTTVGRFVSIEGAVEIAHAEQGNWRPASLDATLCENDSVRVGANSRAAVALTNDAVLRLDQNTTMRLIDVSAQPQERSILDLVVGAFKSFSRAPRTMTVNTPYVNGMIEGTEFAMRVEGSATRVNVFEGKVLTANEFGEVRLGRGQSAVAAAGKPPQPYTMVRQDDAVQWTLYYPPILSAMDLTAQPQSSVALAEASRLAAAGDSAAALASLDKVPAGSPDARLELTRAALLLNVGQVEQASASIESALTIDPNAGLAYALRAVIGVARNEHDRALEDGRKALALAETPASRVALSYALQSNFRLEEAREILREGAARSPQDALLLARLAELELMFGERRKALDAARAAEALQPDLARVQTVLGFAALAENRLGEAKAAFNRAVERESSDPLGHLGRGLAIIRGGALGDGRRELEAAVALDGSNALLRSYLGKGYYEEKRSPLDEQQFAIAKETDAKDPTPYFYDAIRKQTSNQPVGALHDLQTAIELNDNRAVYRSRLLLDSDLAARGASLARVYSDLGFQSRALVEGWNSVNTDPSSFSAHRFLADSYAVLPRHEIARVSELLQSQLLQPLNTTPIQPRLAESDLLGISAGGPASVSFNEFNQVFNRDGVTLQTSGMVGAHQTSAGEGVLAGIYRKLSFSVGGMHYQTDGFRANADQEDDIGNAFVQFELTPGTSLQAEYRYRNTEYGDLSLRFFPENFFATERNSEERKTYRVGLRHDLSTRSTLLVSAMYQDASFKLRDQQPPEPGVTLIDLNRPEEALGAEVQHLYRSGRFNLTSGFGYFDSSGEILATTGLDLPPPPDGPGPITVDAIVDTDLRHVNVYSYANVRATGSLTLTLGGSGDFLDGASAELEEGVDQFNPKAGVTWEPVTGTVFRAAAFRTLKRTLITNQTLEPTQVAGFNQFFDDFNGTEAWRYGAAVDQKFSANVFGGVEASMRDLSVPFLSVTDIGDLVPSSADWEEYLARAYLFWTPFDRWAVSGEYQFERQLRAEELPDGVTEVNTHRLPFAVRYFHPCGFSSSLKATFFHQQGEFEDISGAGLRGGTSNFYTVDAAISYRLPKRYGVLSIGASNLFDREFDYFDTDARNPTITPSRAWFARVTIALP